MHMGDILEEADLPLRYTAYTPCFRREKMSAGRDVRGIKRGHQFDKVEMYTFCKPEESDAELEKMLADAEDTLQLLGSAPTACCSSAPATWGSIRGSPTTWKSGRRAAGNGWRFLRYRTWGISRRGGRISNTSPATAAKPAWCTP